MSIFRIVGVASAALLVAGCAVNFNDLVAEIDQTQLGKSPVCQALNPVPPQLSAAPKGGNLYATSNPQVARGNTGLPTLSGFLPSEIANNHVLIAVHAQLQHATLKADLRLSQAQAVQASGVGAAPAYTAELMAVAPPAKPAINLTQADFAQFADILVKYLFRHTAHGGSPQPEDPFAKDLSAYYQTFYAGNFVTYFGKKLEAPKLSTTITDDQIDQAATVLLELIFDELLQTPVWSQTTTTNGKKSTTTYYPGGTTDAPTVTTYLQPKPLAASGCDMTLKKAQALSYVSQRFATAAVAETSIAVKTAGGLSIGFGVLGKLNIGDNDTLTKLIQTVVSEAVLRLSADFAAKILVNINQPPDNTSTSQTHLQVAKVANGAVVQSAPIHDYSSLFVGAN